MIVLVATHFLPLQEQCGTLLSDGGHTCRKAFHCVLREMRILVFILAPLHRCSIHIAIIIDYAIIK